METRSNYKLLYLFKSLQSLVINFPRLESYLNANPPHLFDEADALKKALEVGKFDTMKSAAKELGESSSYQYAKIRRVNLEDVRLVLRFYFFLHPDDIPALFRDQHLHGWMELDNIMREVLHRRLRIKSELRVEIFRALFPYDPRLGDFMIEMLKYMRFDRSIFGPEMDAILSEDDIDDDINPGD